MDIAVQLVVEVVVAHVLQGGAASGALEALHVKVLVLDSHEHTPAKQQCIQMKWAGRGKHRVQAVEHSERGQSAN